jgi:hypothetical protein
MIGALQRTIDDAGRRLTGETALAGRAGEGRKRGGSRRASGRGAARKTGGPARPK